MFEVADCVKMIRKYYRKKPPLKGQWIAYEIPQDLPLVQFQRPMGNDHIALLSRWCCALAWTNLSAEHFVDLFEMTLREIKVIAVDSNLAVQNAAVFAFAPMLQPLHWMGVFIPILP